MTFSTNTQPPTPRDGAARLRTSGIIALLLSIPLLALPAYVYTLAITAAHLASDEASRQLLPSALTSLRDAHAYRLFAISAGSTAILILAVAIAMYTVGKIIAQTHAAKVIKTPIPSAVHTLGATLGWAAVALLILIYGGIAFVIPIVIPPAFEGRRQDDNFILKQRADVDASALAEFHKIHQQEDEKPHDIPSYLAALQKPSLDHTQLNSTFQMFRQYLRVHPAVLTPANNRHIVEVMTILRSTCADDVILRHQLLDVLKRVDPGAQQQFADDFNATNTNGVAGTSPVQIENAFEALDRKNIDLFEHLLDHPKIDLTAPLPKVPNDMNPTCGAALLWRAIQNDRTQALADLLQHGADINTPLAYGLTPLQYALAGLHEKSAIFLLQHNADVHAVTAPSTNHSTITTQGMPIVLLAMYTHNLDVLKTALDKGADPNQLCGGQSPLQLLNHNFPPDERRPMEQLLRTHGATDHLSHSTSVVKN